MTTVVGVGVTVAMRRVVCRDQTLSFYPLKQFHERCTNNILLGFWSQPRGMRVVAGVCGHVFRVFILVIYLPSSQS